MAQCSPASRSRDSSHVPLHRSRKRPRRSENLRAGQLAANAASAAQEVKHSGNPPLRPARSTRVTPFRAKVRRLDSSITPPAGPLARRQAGPRPAVHAPLSRPTRRRCSEARTQGSMTMRHEADRLAGFPSPHEGRRAAPHPRRLRPAGGMRYACAMIRTRVIGCARTLRVRSREDRPGARHEQTRSLRSDEWAAGRHDLAGASCLPQRCPIAAETPAEER